jgi:hypothetical protein
MARTVGVTLAGTLAYTKPWLSLVDPVARGGVHATGYDGGDDSDEIAILGKSRARSDSPYDEAIHTMQEADVPSSRPVRSEPALGGGVGVGAWGPQDGGNGMALDSVTDMAGAGACARSGVGSLGSGQRTNDSGGQGTGGSGFQGNEDEVMDDGASTSIKALDNDSARRRKAAA